MKRTMIMAGLLLMATYCMAQALVESERSHRNAFSSVPKEMTLDGKPYMAAVSYDFDSDKSGMGIYSSFGPDGAVLNFEVPNTLSSSAYYEKVAGYGEKVVMKGKFLDGMGDETSYQDSTIEAIEAGIKKAFAYPEWFHITEFTDADGEKGYYGNDYRRYSGDSTRCFYNYAKYGKTYPMEYFMVDADGILRYCHFFHYEVEYDVENATWTKDLDYSRKAVSNFKEFTCTVQCMRFQNLDYSFFPNNSIVVSQNIFNKDSEWEYIMMDVEYYQEFGTAQNCEDEVVRRTVRQTPIVKGYIIMNSKGEQVLYIPVPDKEGEYTLGAEIELVSVMNGIIYMSVREAVFHGSIGKWEYGYDECESMYAIDPNTVGVQSITRRAVKRMNIDVTAVGKGENLGIFVSEPAQGENIVVSNMSGQLIYQTPLSDTEHVSIETSAYPKGVYNVTLQSNSAPENQRVIIK
jgi:hypothetical protein